MASDSPGQNAPPQGELQSMLARLQGMMNALNTQEEDDLLPTFDTPPAPANVPLAMPVAAPVSQNYG